MPAGLEGKEGGIGPYVAAACAAWPALAVDPADLARWVAARTSAAGEAPPLAHAGDMCLAFACAHRVPGAVEAFHHAYDRIIARVLSRRRAQADVADDAAQIVHERLLVAAPGALPKISEYAGTGSLKSWVSTTAATTVLMMHRAAGRRREDAEVEDGAGAPVAASPLPDLAYMKARYKNELEGAVVAALARLGDRERTLLRLHLGELVSIDRIGAMYKVDRSTAARWLAAARASLIAAARGEAKDRLRLDDNECDSIAALVQSELHVSVARLLGSP